MLIRRLLQFQTRLSSQVLWRVPATSYTDCSDSVDKVKNASSGPIDKVKEAMLKDAEEFIANLDESGLEKMKEIKQLHEFLKGEASDVPETIPVTSWKALITENHSFSSRVKYFRKLYLDERAKETSKRRKEEKRIQREEKYSLAKKDLTIPQFSINYSLRTRDEARWHKLRSLQSDIDVIFDLNYEQREREYINTVSQMQGIWGLNKTHLQPLKIHLTSIRKNRHFDRLRECDSSGFSVEHDKHFLEIFDRSNLVYLSPDSPPMRKFDRNCTYVIGGVVDLMSRKHQSLGLARQLGIRSVSFPIKLHCDLRVHKPNTILTLNAVFGILLDMYLHGSWDRAFKDHLGKKFPLFSETEIQGYSDQWKEAEEKANFKKHMMMIQKTLPTTNKDLYKGS